MAFCVTFSALAQEMTVTGTVNDDTGETLPSATITIKGTTTGTVTDLEGKYSLKVPSSESVLVFSYVGFNDKEVVVGTQSVIDVTLSSNTILDEIVVTALGISREKKALGYASQQVDGDEISKSRTTNAINALSGKVAGVQISTPSGNLGGSSRILIRGAGSITQNNRPLFVVDGVPLDNSNYNSTDAQNGGGGRDYGDAGFDINPDDIASMNVLKGGPAAALYGSRAQNGVIIITTKSGKSGKVEVVLNTGVAFDQVNILPSVQKKYGGGGGSSSTIGQVGFNTATINGSTFDIVDYATDESWGPKYENQQVLHWDAFDPEFADDYLQTRAWAYPANDREDFFNTGVSVTNSVSLSMGTDKSNMRLSFGNVQQSGIVPNSELEKTTVNFNASSNLTDKLKIGAGVNMTVTEGFNRPEFGYGGASVILQFYQFGQTSLDFERLKKYQLADGTQRTWNRVAFDDASPRYTDNPYWIINKNTSSDRRLRWYGNLNAQYNFTDDLYLVGNLYNDSYSLTISERTALGSQAQSAYSKRERNFQETNYEGRLHYNKNLMDNKFNINSFIGMNRRDVRRTSLLGETQGGLVVDGIYNINNSTDSPVITDFESLQRVNSVFGSVSFGYDNFLYLTVTGRNDWDSTLPEGDNSYFYPSVNASVLFDQFIDVDWLSFAKLRGGWASVGNGTDPYNLSNTFQNRVPFFGDIRYTQPTANLNSNLGPEEKSTWEVGLEMAFLDRRVSFDVTYYNETTSDLITPVQVDPSTGYGSTFTNAGKLENKGIELLLSGTPVSKGDFTWDVTVNFARNRNKLLELLPGVNSLQLARFPFNGVSLNAVVGQPYGIIRGTNYVFDDAGNRVVDASGRYLETRDVENLGSVLPNYTMGINNSFNYKGVSFSFLIDHQNGGKYRSLTNIWGNYSGILEQTATGNIREEGVVLGGVTGTVTYAEDGSYTVTNTAPNTTVISAQRQGQDHFFRNDNQNVFDADYFKLREITLGYTLPNKFIGPFSQVTFTAFARNLLVWGLDNDNFDPEVATGGSGNIQGSEGGSMPSTRSFGMNLTLKF
ncbi:MAG: TonB-linked SusC/RagA family outer membrane protein [Bacteroidia bacterium]|jgi:TonB-linked SusC/RagA family outer membrane protein